MGPVVGPTTVTIAAEGKPVDLEAEVLGAGEPVVVIQTALTADELRPLALQMATRLGAGDQVVHYHRRGYAGSAPQGPGPPSVAADSEDCHALVAALDLAPVHVVGASYSAAIALDLAASHPEDVRTLTVVEPPPVHVPSAVEFREANAWLLRTYRDAGPASALDTFMTMLVGPDWRVESGRDLPGSVAAMERDASTFFERDLPAMMSWSFGPAEAARITCPVLHIGGSESGPWFEQVLAWAVQLLPQAQVTTVAGAGHLVGLTHAEEVARRLVAFLAATGPASSGGVPGR
jgi:pimeloyl-ACP methyl ester carboxylesterase